MVQSVEGLVMTCYDRPQKSVVSVWNPDAQKLESAEIWMNDSLDFNAIKAKLVQSVFLHISDTVKIQTGRKADTDQLSQIQISLDFRHSLYPKKL